ncbi:MAG: nucleotidyl transferase AbiEii/AbiGii toxin family protein [Oscillospiraceae bacterium]|nr:nucleotidyl transferase AbiEii/AbiGii toxin family protein [Oscillospiraceae bacterium]
MNWYKEYKDQWKEIIETVAAETRRTTLTVEKDTVQSMFLFELSKCDIPFVFKGGTSLSKAYGLIDRFSEDIDLSASGKLSESERKSAKAIITSIADTIGLVLINPDDVLSRHSYNKYVFEYASLFSEIPMEIIVETSFYQAVYPVETHKVGSFIGDFCERLAIKLPVPFEASSFAMPVQSLERTFIDKVFAVCDYRIQDMQDRDSRHLYDIAKILPHIAFTPALYTLVKEVRADRMKSQNNPSAKPQYDIPKMLKEIIRSRFYESDYNSITKKLLYEDVSYDEAIKNGISRVSETDLFQGN